MLHAILGSARAADGGAEDQLEEYWTDKSDEEIRIRQHNIQGGNRMCNLSWGV